MHAKTTQAPPWLVKLLTPFIARQVAREMQQKYPGLGAAEIAEKMRAELPSGLDPEQGQVLINAVTARLPATAEPAAADAKPVSAWILVVANLLPLYAVIFWKWEVFPLLVLFWLENVIIGLLNAARMLLIDPRDPALWAAKLFSVPFFCVHYGMFTFVHGLFVLAMFGQGKISDRVPEHALHAIEQWNLWLPLGALAASHLFSFLWNYLYRGEFRRASLHEQMFKPYARVMILHLTILAGGFAVMVLGSPLWMLLVLIGIKLALDLRAHVKEHRV